MNETFPQLQGCINGSDRRERREQHEKEKAAFCFQKKQRSRSFCFYCLPLRYSGAFRETGLNGLSLTAETSPERACRAFTLVEMLVVIAIIGLLAAMLVPALARSRDYAMLAKCRNRLRNAGVGLLIYADEHEGHLPVSRCVDGPHRALVKSLRERYVQDVRSFYCPAETHPRRRYTHENAKAGRIGYFYYGCRERSKNRSVSGYLRIDVTWPRQLHTSMDPGTWVMSDGWFRGESTPHCNYRKGMNYLTLSGSVEFLESSPRSAFK